ncbi:hypothetical protein ACFPER_15405 [Agromyces aurantiacus]|uniref:AbiEi antitoxin C-terminal domain-containing protein n=1 Tax=Agromyces aurantiacus TaxID=165814 RepID=A0ABV9R8R6_9MICO|nr:hypothetical protein [Agromyces aurantiacus]MBM7504921.1 hypothetical protein [Agromyces aurantiacus]
MARLPAVLGTDDLPLAELCAARLDGELVRIGTGWCPVDEPDLPALRAAAVASRLPPPLIVERRSAAWVHGGLPAPPAVAQFCVPHESRVAARNDPSSTVREVTITAAEVVELGRIRCTSLDRTVFDLARDTSEDDAGAIAVVRALLAVDPTSAGRVRARIGSARRLPHRAVAQRRLDTAAGPVDQPSLTR